MTQAWLSLGSNLHQPLLQLKLALEHLRQADGIDNLESSSFYRTPPWGDSQQAAFINAVVRLTTSLEPSSLLCLVQAIENDMGRIRTSRRWGPRLIDIDVLLYGGQCVKTADLEIPHPRMHERAFILVPMAELDVEMKIPGRGKIGNLLEQVDAKGICRLTDAENR